MRLDAALAPGGPIPYAYREAKARNTALLVLHPDISSGELTAETVQALKETAQHIGKLDRSFEAGQIAEIEAALAQLQNALRLKKRNA